MRRKRIGKKTLSVILAIVVLLTTYSIAFTAIAAEKEININMELLDAVLNERSWIINTLVNDSFMSNPYAIVNDSYDDTSILDQVLTNYQNDDSFRYLVNVMEVYQNPDEYISNAGDAILDIFGGEEGLSEFVASVGELKFESIIKDVLQQNYTATWGETLFEENLEVEKLKQQAKMIKKLSKYQKALIDRVGMAGANNNGAVFYDPVIGDGDYYVDIDDYATHFIDAYEEDLYNYVSNTVDLSSVTGSEALKKKIISYGAMTVCYAYERTVLPEAGLALDDIYYDGMFDDTLAILKAAGKPLEIAEKTTDYAIFLESLCAQKDTMVDTMTRISQKTTNEDVKAVFTNMSQIAEEAGEKRIISHESVTNYLRNEKVVTNFVGNYVKKKAGKLFTEGISKTLQISPKVAKATIAELMVLKEVGEWVLEQTTGIKETSKKIYICKYVDKLITEVKKIFNIDLNAYKNDKTEENAKKVLDDLQFLKELRLYGEKTAYDSMAAQMDSWIGELLSSGVEKSGLDYQLQCMTDIYLGCTFSPVSAKPFQMQKGDRLFLMTITHSGKEYSQATYLKPEGNPYYFAEADLRLMGGINLNGGTVDIITAPNGIYLPLITNTEEGGKILVKCDNVNIGTIDNSGTLSVSLPNEQSYLNLSDSLVNTGTLDIEDAKTDSKIIVYDMSNSGTLNIQNTCLNVKGDATNNGTVTGKVNICGDNTLSYQNAYFTIINQIMYGDGEYSHLYFDSATKTGIKIKGSQRVNTYISNPSTRLRNSERLYATGNCKFLNNAFNGNLSFENFTSTTPLTLNGDMYIYKNATLGGQTNIKGGLRLTESAETVALNAPLIVYGDTSYKNGKITGSGTLQLNGDISISAASPTITNLLFEGTTAQSCYSSNNLYVSHLKNTNTSLGGVSFNSPVYVTEKLSLGPLSDYVNGKNIILTNEAKLDGDVIKGSISASGWTCSDNAKLNGTLYGVGDVTLSDGVTLNVASYNQTSGTLNISETATLVTDDYFSTKSTVANNGTISVKTDSNITGGFTGGNFITKGNIQTSGGFTPKTLTFNGTTAQSIGGSDVSVEQLTNSNTSLGGVTFNTKTYVTDKLIADKINKHKNGINLVLTGTAIIDSDSLQGDITVEAWECTQDTNIKGTVYGSKDVSISGENTLNTLNYIQETGSLVVDENSELYCEGNLQSDVAISNNGNITVKSDCELNGDLTGGEFSSKGDLNCSSTFTPDTLTLNGKTAQTFNNSATTTVKNLTLDNNSLSGVNIASVINVSESYTNNCKKLINGQNVVLTDFAKYFENGESKGDISVTGNLTIPAGETLTISGKLRIKDGATLTIEDGATLIVKQSIISNSSTINIGANGTLKSRDYFKSTSDKINVNGNFIVMSDCKTDSSTLCGDGTITFKGDLKSSSCSWENPNVSFESKLPQTISGSTISANNLKVANNSKNGITFNCGVNYYGAYENTSSLINGEANVCKGE